MLKIPSSHCLGTSGDPYIDGFDQHGNSSRLVTQNDYITAPKKRL
jgi:hypothetical protein